MDVKESVISHFDKAAGAYYVNYEGDNIISHSFNSRLSIVLSFAGDVNNKKVLDVGCGPGILARYFSPGSCDFTGIDISEKMIQECIRDNRLSKFYFYAQDPLAFFRENAASRYHVVICMGLFEYLTEEYSKSLLSEISGHLYPEGIVIATYPNIYSPYRIADGFYRSLFRKEAMVPPYTPGVKHKEFSEHALRKEWRGYGLQVVKAAYYNFRIIPKPMDRILKSTDLHIAKRLQFLSLSRLRFLATAMVIKGRKIC